MIPDEKLLAALEEREKHCRSMLRDARHESEANYARGGLAAVLSLREYFFPYREVA